MIQKVVLKIKQLVILKSGFKNQTT